MESSTYGCVLCGKKTGLHFKEKRAGKHAERGGFRAWESITFEVREASRVRRTNQRGTMRKAMWMADLAVIEKGHGGLMNATEVAVVKNGTELDERRAVGHPKATEDSSRQGMARDLIKQIAMDIGKDVAAYIEVMYPKAVEATSSTFLLSVRNHTYNEIMGALEVDEEGAIVDRLADRKVWRRQWKAMYRKMRAKKALD